MYITTYNVLDVKGSKLKQEINDVPKLPSGFSKILHFQGGTQFGHFKLFL
jgi:hypothetical protein